MEIEKKTMERRYYQIKVQDLLEECWTDWFDGLTISYEDENTTILKGEIVDDAALHGILKKIRDLGLTLLSVNVLTGGNDNSDK